MAHSTLPVFSHPSFPQHQIPQLSTCCYVSPLIGLCDGAEECRQAAVVHHVATEMDYCADHWRAVSRG